MPAVSKKQQKFFGIVRAIQKGEQVPNTPETAKAAADMKKGDVKKFASTKHKGLPEKKVTKEESNIYNEGSLHKWFKGSKSKDGKPGWVNVKTGGTCASDEPGEGTPKCVSSAKRASMSKSERESASRRKKAADPNQQSKTGAAKPTYVSTDKPKKKVSEAMNFSKFKARAMDAAKKAVAKKSVSKKSSSSYVGQRDAGAIAAKRMRDKEQQKYVGFLPANESVEEAVYTGPDKKDRALIKKMYDKKGNPSDYAKKLEKYKKDNPEKVKKIQDKVDKSMKFTHEGTSYGLYKGSGKPSGAMAAFAKNDKDKKKKEVKKEEVEQIDELSKTTTANYLYRARVDKDFVHSNKMGKYQKARDKGIQRAEKKLGKKTSDKLRYVAKYDSDSMRQDSGKTEYPRKIKVKEEVEVVNEVSSKTLRNYIIKGTKDVAKRASDPDSDSGPKYGKKMSRIDGVSKAADKLAKKASSDARMKEEVEVTESDKKGKGSGTKDACYHKVKASAKVWPSAYASGRLVQCRKKGASNWGNSKKESFSDWRSEFIWEDGDSVKKIEEGKSPAWQRKEGKSESGGLNQKGVASYRAANPGSKLKTAVTTKPSKLKKGSKAANRRKSFCSRMKGMKAKLTSAKTARDPDSRINKSLRKWNC